MSILDSLKIERSGYRLAVTTAVSDLQDTVGLYGTPMKEIETEAREYVNNHEWFETFNGADCGAVVELAETDTSNLTRWHVCQDAEEALLEMAKEAFLTDIMRRVEEHKESI